MFTRPEAKQQASKNRRYEAPRSCSCQPIEIETRSFGSCLLHHGRGSKYFVMKIRPVPSRRARTRFAIRHRHLKGGGRRFIHRPLYARKSPEQHGDGENPKREAKRGGLPGGVKIRDIVSSLFPRHFLAVVFKIPKSL